MSEAADRFLARLAHAHQYGTGWRADCPVGHSSRGSLAVAVGEDGRVLLQCFAGCSAADIVVAAGLTLADLFPARVRDDTPAGRRAARAAHRQSAWGAALRVLAGEATVVEAAAAMIERGGELTAEDVERVHVAAQLIRNAREVLA